MKRCVRVLWCAALVALACGAGQAQDKVLLTVKAQAGQVERSKSEGTFTMDAGGMKFTIEMKETEKVTFTAVAASGDVTMERETESQEVSFNGQKTPAPDDAKEKSTVTVRPDGSLVSYKSESEQPDPEKTGVRLTVATSPVFSDKPVGVGDKWSRDYKADSDLGVHAGHADFEVLGFEKVGGVDTVKVKMTFKESEGSPALGVSGTVWVEKSSGDSVAADYEVENLQFGGGDMGALANGKLHQERVSGGPLASSGTTTGTATGGKADTKTETKSDAKKEKTIDETVKDYEKIPGLFTLYRKKEAGRDSIYMEIRQDQLDKLIMMEVTASTGTSSQVVAGNPLNDLLFKFSKIEDDKLMMVTPNIGYRTKENTPLARAVRRSFADAYLESYKIEASQPDRKSMLINVSDLFRGDIAEISNMFSGGGGNPLAALMGGGGASYSMDREKTFIVSLKNFPENLFVETSYHFMRSGGGRGGIAALLGGGSDVLADARSIPFKVNYNLFMLPDNGYRPRLADPRVGYFTADYQDLTDDSLSDQMVRYIYRWDLQKSDPKAALSPPKKPIVFWLDNAIPLEYRGAVRDAILRWNKAFEKVGFKDAIVVKQMPDNADWDHADMRYNTIRWVMSPSSGYAVALARVNPITGQVLNANITVDGNLIRDIKGERKAIVDPSTVFRKPSAATLSALPADPRACDMGAGAVEQAWFGNMALSLIEPNDFDQNAYIQSFIRYVVCHEMGHILGLRHNFIGSTLHSMDELKHEEKIHDSGITASVMDYVAFNVSAIKQKGVDYWTDTVGPYDIWAIQYGYTSIPASSPENELPKLKAIASRCNEPGHAYQTDENADTFDPAVTRWDLASDPLAYWTRRLEISRYLLFHLAQRLPKPGESYWKFTSAFNGMLGQYAQAMRETSRYIGGLHVNRNHRGDPGEKPTLMPISAAEQKKALQLMNTYLFAENAFSLPRSYYTKMTVNPFGGFDISSILSGGANQQFPIRDTLSNLQGGALESLFDGSVLTRIVNNEFKIGDPSQAFTLPTLFHSVGATVWSELEGRRNIGALRRQLQRRYLTTIIDMVVNPSSDAPEDAKMLAWDQLRQLKGRILSAQRYGRYDDYTRVHLDESLMRVNRALAAQVMIGSPAAPAQSPLQRLLGGGQQ